MKTDSRQQQYVMRRAILVARQGALCPCGGILSTSVVIDHDHSCCPTDRADRTCGDCDRAAMHASCNTAIGAVRDSAERLLALANYAAQFQVSP